MTDENESNGKCNDKPEKPYKVGYKKPPPEHQFKKGQSGNPRGRPPIDKNPRVLHVDDLRNCLLDAANRPVKIVENGKEVYVPAIHAIYHQMVMAAMKGDKQARRDLLKMVPQAYLESEAIQIKYWEMIADAEAAREEEYNNMTPYEREMERHKYYSGRRSWRNLTGKPESKPFEPYEPRDERDWKVYEQYLEDLKNGRPGQWPPAYWDEESSDQQTPPADPEPPPKQQ